VSDAVALRRHHRLIHDSAPAFVSVVITAEHCEDNV